MAERTVAIVQARMGSQRFPGKMMALLRGRPLIEWVLHRSRGASRLDEVVLATTTKPEDDVLVAEAKRLGIATFRGSVDDVLARYGAAARVHRADVVVRICADRPLVAPEAIDAVVKAFYDGRPDIAFNHISWLGQNWPRGFGAEVLSYERLEWLDRTATAPPHREHVTLYLHEHADAFRLATPACPPELDTGKPDVALDVDLPAHLSRLREVCADLDIDSTAAELMAAWARTRQSQ